MLKTIEAGELGQRDGPADCPACSGDKAIDVFRGPELPANVGVFYDSALEAMNAPRGGITLTYCPSCGLVFNRQFDAEADIFKPGYEVALHHSETFRNYIEGVAARLVERFDLKGKRIVEIGCGDAYFLKRLAELGGNDCIGIDPTVAAEGAHPVDAGSVELVRDYFGAAHQHHDADFVCCLSVFEDIPRPESFLAAAHALASRKDAPLYFEVFNAWRALDAQEVWSVHYEQCNYFSLQSLKRVFALNGFSVEAASTCYEGDQYLFVEARTEKEGAVGASAPAEREVPQTLLTFEDNFRKNIELWNGLLADCKQKNERVVVWGTGGKGITFLNSLDDARSIEFVAEINPDKQGKYLPGTGQKIVPPEFLAEYQPHKIIITNALYEREMKQQARAMGVEAEFLIA